MDHNESFRQLCTTLMELAVNVGIIGSVMDTYPEYAQENWEEKIEQMTIGANNLIVEVQEFASALD